MDLTDFHATASKNMERLQPETAAALQKCDFTTLELSILVSEMFNNLHDYINFSSVLLICH